MARWCVTLPEMLSLVRASLRHWMLWPAACLMLLAGCGGEQAEPLAPVPFTEIRSTLDKGGEVPDAQRELEARASKLIGDGASPQQVLDDELRAQRGRPVVVNIWAQWCEPCKRELPIFQRVALEHRADVAFLGVAADRSGKARELLSEIPLPFPSVLDPDAEISNAAGVKSLPKTLFYDATGKRTHVKLGDYPSIAALQEDLERYAGLKPSSS